MAKSVAKYIVSLSDEERSQLRELVRKGKVSARRLNRAHILLQADAQTPDRAIAASLHVGTATVERTRKRFVEEGLEAALGEGPWPGGVRKLNDKQEAHLIALACSPAPEGRSRWTMQLLADRLVELQVVDSISDECVRTTLKRGASSPG